MPLSLSIKRLGERETGSEGGGERDCVLCRMSGEGRKEGGKERTTGKEREREREEEERDNQAPFSLSLSFSQSESVTLAFRVLSLVLSLLHFAGLASLASSPPFCLSFRSTFPLIHCLFSGSRVRLLSLSHSLLQRETLAESQKEAAERESNAIPT